MDKYRLPTSIKIQDKILTMKTDYRDILFIFEIYNDPDLLDNEKVLLALENFYKDKEYMNNLQESYDAMMMFINCGNTITPTARKKPLYDWDQDYDLIVAPITKSLGTDIRGMEYLHWWTFIALFHEIGESRFSSVVSIRNKLNKHKKLEKWEKDMYRENREMIDLKKKYDSVTEDLINQILRG